MFVGMQAGGLAGRQEAAAVAAVRQYAGSGSSEVVIYKYVSTDNYTFELKKALLKCFIALNHPSKPKT